MGAFGVADGLLDKERVLVIEEALWTPVEAKMTTPPVRVKIKVVGEKEEAVEAVEE